jgi:hypothetical protein
MPTAFPTPITPFPEGCCALGISRIVNPYGQAFYVYEIEKNGQKFEILLPRFVGLDIEEFEAKSRVRKRAKLRVVRNEELR